MAKKTQTFGIAYQVLGGGWKHCTKTDLTKKAADGELKELERVHPGVPFQVVAAGADLAKLGAGGGTGG